MSLSAYVYLNLTDGDAQAVHVSGDELIEIPKSVLTAKKIERKRRSNDEIRNRNIYKTDMGMKSMSGCASHRLMFFRPVP